MNDKIKNKVNRKQKTIVSDNTPLYRYGYWRRGYTEKGKQRWVLREYQYHLNNKKYGRSSFNIRSKLVDESWEEYHRYLQRLIPKYNKISESDKERMNKYNLYRENKGLIYG